MVAVTYAHAAEMEEAAGGGHGEALQFLKSLASSSVTYSIPQFPVKWQSIRDKLQQLCSNLSALGVNGDGCPELCQVLQSTLPTLNHIQLIASHCSDESYGGGKLLLRSDLDHISFKLDTQIKHLREMISSRIPPHSQAIIAARPAIGASLQDKTFYIKDLFSRMRIGDSVIRSQALATIRDLLSEDDECVRIVALDIDDGISLLTTFLESTDVGVQAEAAGAVSIISAFDSHRGVLVKAGVIAPLIQALESAGTSVSGKERAAQALRELTENSDNVWAVSAHGGLATLLNTCANVDSGGKLVSSAWAVLKNLSRVEEMKTFMIEQGAVSELAELSQQKEEARKIGSIELLHSIAFDDAVVKQEAVNAGVIQSLIHLLNPDLPYSSKAREVALAAIEFFCFSSTNLIDDVMGSKFLGWLLFYLENGECAVQECALKIVRCVSKISEEYNRIIGRAGFMTALASLLGAKSCQVRETAAEVLCNLLLLHPNRLIFIQEEDNLKQLLQLLDPREGKLMATEFILSAIMSLAETNNGKKKILSSKHFSSLKELADSGDFDAKKIIKKLSTNRLQTILSKIWSL